MCERAGGGAGGGGRGKIEGGEGLKLILLTQTLTLNSDAFIWCLGKALLRDCGIFWVSGFIFQIAIEPFALFRRNVRMFHCGVSLMR